MKCNVVRDLLPLYLDQLCEEETGKEIKDHLECCESCRQRWEEMRSPVDYMIDQWERELVSIEPMKKYQKKIKRKNRAMVMIILLSAAVIGLLSYLSYGQIRHTGVSFETISQYIRFQYVGREFARGNLEPLLSGLAIVGDDPEHAYYAKQAYGDDEHELLRDTKEYIRNRYSDYFQGKPLKLRRVMVQYYTNLVYQTRNLMVVLFYEIDGIKYYIRLERRGGEQYYVTQDKFASSVEPITYYVGGGEDKTEDVSSGTEEGYSSLLECRESLFKSLPPFDDMSLFVARRTSRRCYRECRESGKTLSPYAFMTSVLYITEECQKDSKLLNAYKKTLIQHAERIIQQDYCIQDMHYQILSYDKEKHMFRYQIQLSLVSAETGEECVLSVECYKHLSEMIVIPETEKLIGENIPEKARRAMLDLWKITST